MSGLTRLEKDSSTNVTVSVNSLSAGLNNLVFCVEKDGTGTLGFRSFQLYRDDTAPVARATPTGYSGGASDVTLACSDDRECDRVIYTTDGSDPTFSADGASIVNGALHTTPLSFPDMQTTTLKFRAIDKAGNVGGVSTETYEIASVKSSVTITYNQYFSAYKAGQPGGVYRVDWQTDAAGQSYRVVLSGDCVSGALPGGYLSTDNVFGVTPASGQTTMSLLRLTPGWSYTIRVCVENAQGWGEANFGMLACLGGYHVEAGACVSNVRYDTIAGGRLLYFWINGTWVLRQALCDDGFIPEGFACVERCPYKPAMTLGNGEGGSGFRCVGYPEPNFDLDFNCPTGGSLDECYVGNFFYASVAFTAEGAGPNVHWEWLNGGEYAEIMQANGLYAHW